MVQMVVTKSLQNYNDCIIGMYLVKFGILVHKNVNKICYGFITNSSTVLSKMK